MLTAINPSWRRHSELELNWFRISSATWISAVNYHRRPPFTKLTAPIHLVFDAYRPKQSLPGEYITGITSTAHCGSNWFQANWFKFFWKNLNVKKVVSDVSGRPNEPARNVFHFFWNLFLLNSFQLFNKIDFIEILEKKQI